MKSSKYIFSIIITMTILSGCVSMNEESVKSVASEDSVVIRPLGTTNREDVKENEPQYYYVSSDSITTVYIRDTEEESFDYDSVVLNFERTEIGFDFTYINFKDEETTKSFEIQSGSIVEDENGVWYEWSGPEEWVSVEE